MTYDVFRPPREPARSIYDAFQAEANLRSDRAVPEWTEREIAVVHAAALTAAAQYGLRAPSVDTVRRAELYARGSIDYGAKWAHMLVRLMTEEP